MWRKISSKIDTLNANLEHKDSLIEQLQGVISQLRGEDGKQKKAFEFAQFIDESDNFKETLRSNQQLNNYGLKQMVQYLQSYMYTNENFSYDTKTIRLFILNYSWTLASFSLNIIISMDSTFGRLSKQELFI